MVKKQNDVYIKPLNLPREIWPLSKQHEHHLAGGKLMGFICSVHLTNMCTNYQLTPDGCVLCLNRRNFFFPPSHPPVAIATNPRQPLQLYGLAGRMNLSLRPTLKSFLLIIFATTKARSPKILFTRLVPPNGVVFYEPVGQSDGIEREWMMEWEKSHVTDFQLQVKFCSEQITDRDFKLSGQVGESTDPGCGGNLKCRTTSDDLWVFIKLLFCPLSRSHSAWTSEPITVRRIWSSG